MLILLNTLITDSRVIRDKSSVELRSASAAAGDTANPALIGFDTAWEEFAAFRVVMEGGENELMYAGGPQHRRVVEPRTRRLRRYRDTSAVQVSLVGSPAGGYILPVEAPTSVPAVGGTSSIP